MVSYARGAKRPAEIDAGWPWQVEIEVPWNGLRGRLVEITAWVREHAPEPASAKRGGSQETTRWGFRDRSTAEAFRDVFGGELVEAKPARERRALAGVNDLLRRDR
jgi:hypothetical protein